MNIVKYLTYIIYSYHLSSRLVPIIIILILQMKRLRLRNIWQLTQCHTDKEYQNLVSNPGFILFLRYARNHFTAPSSGV